jgi:hypothetical protein
MSSSLLSVLLVCDRKILRHVMFILIGPHVKHFSVFNVKKINHGLPLCQNNVNGVYLKFLENII